jgi:glycosyltransferase involved in cell wall biosynthesis
VRVLHVVTLVSPDAAFGGPVRVAENQAAALRARGHEVTVAATSRGYGDAPPTVLGGAPLRLFPVRRLVPPAGFSGMTSLGLLAWWWSALRAVDVVHVHLARDLVTLPAAELARRRGVPYVVQPHGMVVESDNPLAGPLDGLLTRRVLRGAEAVFHLTPEEQRGLETVGGRSLALERLGNGVPDVADLLPLPARPAVLFCARLQERKRPVLFARTARALLDEGVDASFALVGPDEGQGAAVTAEVAAVGDPERLRWEGPLDPSQTLGRMARASLVVLPSVDEPYPMSVLEAMSAGRAVVVTDSCGLAPAVAEHGCGAVVDASPEALRDAVRRLLADPAELARTGERAARTAREHFSMSAVAERLEAAYRRAVARRAITHVGRAQTTRLQ